MAFITDTPKLENAPRAHEWPMEAVRLLLIEIAARDVRIIQLEKQCAEVSAYADNLRREADTKQ